MKCYFVICMASLCLLDAASAGESTPVGFEVATVSYLGEQRKEKMDVYSPLPHVEQGTRRPAVLYIHGGGWGRGSKSGRREQAIAGALAAHGYVTFSIDYHLTHFEGQVFKSAIHEPGWPQNIYDCKSAVRYIRKHAMQYGVNPDAIGVMGCSAGGHLALLTAMSSENEQLNSGGLYKNVPCHVSCAICFYGIPDVRAWGGGAFMGVDRVRHADQWALASPVTHLNNNSPPVLLVHGDSDKIVDVKLSIDFAEELKKKNVPHKLIIVEGGHHGFELDTPKFPLESELFDFLKEHLEAANGK
jgi:acetyl esterase/lipase